ncbi:DUF4335 domain-containing protein [Synechocystis sp. LKSZ1]|uniref:DUF4335 domain-containing protein n=1 Tax=Synechocystis sp. LKSZ1 TaxID=3144951 RepID=UPI00336C0DFC
MLSRTRILRSYTPPTCRLELLARLPLWEALGRQSHSPLPEDFQFELRFDDPRLPEDRQAILRGSATQLRELQQVLEAYLQNFLSRSLVPASAALPESSEAPVQYATLNSLSLQYCPPLHHQFCFGRLDSPSHANPLLTLSSSQLFDLAQALTAFAQETHAPAAPLPWSRTQRWGWGVGAVVGIATVMALTHFGIRTISENPTALENLPSNPPIKNRFSFTEVIPPVPPAPGQGPFPQANLPTPLAARPTLPPPGNLSSATPPPRNATVNLVVPPSRVLPPPPVVPPAPASNTITIPPPSAVGSSVIPEAALLPQANLPILPPQGPGIANFQGQILPQAPQLPPLAQGNVGFSFPSAPRPEMRPTPSLLDPIPQVAEVRAYYEKYWQPPQELQQTLEYRLQLDPNGTLKQTTPLGKAASLYLAKLPQPNPGSPWVSPLTVEGERTIRLVLSPNGSVKTFLDE